MSQQPRHQSTQSPSPYRFISQAKLPTIYGEFDIHVFENDEGQEHVMLTCGLPTLTIDMANNDSATKNSASRNIATRNTDINNSPAKTTATKAIVTDMTATKDQVAIDNAPSQSPYPQPPLVRIHSECLTGDTFSSLKCDCGPQLNATMQAIQDEGYGAILYLRQEGRGIGLTNKIRAYALQDQGHDTLDANLLLGLPADARTYEMCKPMLDHIGITDLRLMTNNPDKLSYLEALGFVVVERIPLIVGVNPLNAPYLNTKRERMGHYINDTLASSTFTPNND